MIFPGTLSDSFAESHWFSEPIVEYLSRWPISDDLEDETVGYGGHGMPLLHVVCGCEAGQINCHIIALRYAGDDSWYAGMVLMV